jgi:hypothetical protein
MRLHILLFSLLLSFGAGAQCNLRPITLAERVQSSALVVEGTVITTWSRWDDLHQNIYTINAVEVLGTFKGQTSDTVIYIVTPGGQVGNDLEISTHAVELNKGKTGLFTLIVNSKPLTEARPLYEVYAAAQGFLRYDRLEHKAHGVFDHYNSLQDLYPAVLAQPGTGLQRRKEVVWSNVNDLPYSLQDVLQSVNESHLQGDSLYSETTASAVAAGATISSFSPTTVQAGRGTLLTINGTGFGATQGTSFVQFLNADAGGASYTPPLATQYVSWSNTQIQVYVPTAAGTGTVRVTDGTNTATSAAVLTVEYAILNVNYSGSYYRPNLVDDNTTGGYTFQLNTAFDANTVAKTDFQNVIYQWRCATGVNWVFGSTTSVATTAADGVNIVRFDSGSELSAGVLGNCTSRYSGCTDGTNFFWYVTELDVTIDDGTNYFYGNVGAPSISQYDFYSVMLHELGHGHQLGHVIDAVKVMHYSLSNGTQKRTISPTELTGASYELSQSTAAGTCMSTAHIDYSCNPSVVLTTGASSVSETGGTTTATATLSKPCFSDVTVTLSLTGTATVASDYTMGTSIVIPSGSLSASITLAAVSDPADETDETVIINITAVTNGTESGTQQQTVTVLDDDEAPTVTLTSGAGSISETGGSTTITATLSATSSQIVTITLGLSGTATSPTDYTLGTTITIPAGNTNASITLAAVSDPTDEANETVLIDITAVTNGTENGTQQQTVTILDDDAAPTVTLSAGSPNISETGGTTTVTATLSTASAQTVTVALGLTGTATIATDYTLGTTITIPAGNTSASITLSTVGDPTDEADETMIIDITAVTNGTENGTQQQTVTILDDDAAPTVTLSAGSPNISETGGTTTVTATLSAASSQIVTVTLGMTGTATIVTDYTLGTTINIPAGSNSASITLATVSDPTDEADETVIVDITAVTNGTESGTQQQTVTILDDDAVPTVTLTTGAGSISETGGTTTVTATLSAASSQIVTITLGMTGTATIVTDYTLGTTINIPAGSNSASITLATVNDPTDEADETVIIDITAVTNGTESGTQQQTVTILDDDAGPIVTLSVGSANISETGGTTTITATLSATSSQTVSITLSLSGTATIATDYTLGTTITIPAGNTSASITLAAVNDPTDEADETVIIDITAVANGTESGTQQQTVTILDDDAAPTVTLTTGTGSISETGGSTTVTATLTTTSSQIVTVTLGMTGTAVITTDYALGATISIPAGSTSASITLAAVSDPTDETDETVIIDITAVTNGTESGTQQQTVIILDDDAAPSITLTTGMGSISETGGATTVTATLSEASSQIVTVTLGMTGTAVINTDYALGTTITIPAGNTSASITLAAVNDPTDEADETVIIDITGVTSGTENGTQQQTVTILDDDAAPSVTLTTGAGSISETGGTTTVTATLSAAASQTVTITLSLSGAATIATDYTVETTITIPAGSTSASIALAAVSDNIDEADEIVAIGIQSILNGTENIPGAIQAITILDDDAAPTVSLSVDNTTTGEGGSVHAIASLSAVSYQNVTVLLTASGMISVSDYTLPGMLTIPAGTTSSFVVLTAQEDLVDEADETILVEISGVTNGVENGAQQQTVTIIDNDAAPAVSLSAGAATVAENGGTSIISVTLSAISEQTVSITFNTTGSATPGTDYSAIPGLTIPAGSLSASTVFTAIDDAAGEPDELAVLSLATIVNAVDNGTTDVVTIIDDEEPEIASSSGANGASYDFGSVPVGSTATATFTITNSGADDLLLSDADYVVLSGADAASFSLETSGLVHTITPGGSVSFDVTVTADCSASPYTAQLTIPNNDGDESSFTIVLIASSVDQTAPVATVNSLPVLNGECSVTATIPSATDNCSGMLTATTSDPLSYTVAGTYTIHWIYTDGAGNVSTQNQQVSVTGDLTAPEISCPGDLLSNIPEVNYSLPTATDNCSSPMVILQSGPASGGTFPEGTTTVTYTATDAAGNITSCSFTVTINTSGIAENETAAISLYPNPASDAVTVTTTGQFDHVLVYDSKGSLAAAFPLLGTSNVIRVDGLETGMYYMTFNGPDAVAVRRLEVLR